MKFNQHLQLEGSHAFLGASKHSWLNYTEEKLLEVYKNKKAIANGIRLHEFAKEAIELGIKLPRSQKTLNSYVNDAIGYNMTPEVVLYYTLNAFGTADAISYNKNYLRIHDLKTGITPASMKQLYIYAALFSLEYNKPPGSIKGELRIYQNDTIEIETIDNEFLTYVVDKIITFDKMLTS